MRPTALRQIHASDGNTNACRPSKRLRVTPKSAGCEPKSPAATLQKPYQRLLDCFTALENQLCLFRDRHQYPTFRRLQPFVSKLSRRSFCLEHVGLMLALDPHLYDVSWTTTVSAVDARSAAHHPSDECNDEPDLVIRLPHAMATSNTGSATSATTMKTTGASATRTADGGCGDRQLLSFSVSGRATHFHALLAAHMLKCTMHYGGNASESDAVRSGDAGGTFLRDDILSELAAAGLMPALPPRPRKARPSAAAVLNEAAIDAAISRAAVAADAAATAAAVAMAAAAAAIAALAKVKSVAPELHVDRDASSDHGARSRPVVSNTSIRKELRGLPSSLLANIRKKQARRDQRQRLEKQASVAQCDPILKHLAPLSEMIYSYVHKARKEVFVLKDLVQHIVGAGTTCVSTERARKQLEALAKQAPEWCTISPSLDGKKNLVRFNTQASYPEIRRKLVHCAEKPREH